jgi:hypothetical protein
MRISRTINFVNKDSWRGGGDQPLVPLKYAHG